LAHDLLIVVWLKTALLHFAERPDFVALYLPARGDVVNLFRQEAFAVLTGHLRGANPFMLCEDQ
jgi:hypothetical protein